MSLAFEYAVVNFFKRAAFGFNAPNANQNCSDNCGNKGNSENANSAHSVTQEEGYSHWV